MYLRAGDPRMTDDGDYAPSTRNDRSGQVEPGISCFEVIDGELVDTPDGELARQARWFAAEGRSWYVVTGTLVGVGSDGEPCLSTEDFYIVDYVDPAEYGIEASWD